MYHYHYCYHDCCGHYSFSEPKNVFFGFSSSLYTRFIIIIAIIMIIVGIIDFWYDKDSIFSFFPQLSFWTLFGKIRGRFFTHSPFYLHRVASLDYNKRVIGTRGAGGEGAVGGFVVTQLELIDTSELRQSAAAIVLAPSAPRRPPLQSLRAMLGREAWT